LVRQINFGRKDEGRRGAIRRPFQQNGGEGGKRGARGRLKTKTTSLRVQDWKPVYQVGKRPKQRGKKEKKRKEAIKVSQDRGGKRGFSLGKASRKKTGRQKDKNGAEGNYEKIESAGREKGIGGNAIMKSVTKSQYQIEGDPPAFRYSRRGRRTGIKSTCVGQGERSGGHSFQKW